MNDSPMKGSEKVKYWQYMNGEDFKKLDKDRCVVAVACSPLEVHGPHLPMGTDFMEAEAITARTIELITERHPDITALILPPIYTATDVLPQTGSIMFNPGTTVTVLTDMGRSLTKQGFKNIWLSNFHGGPRHVLALEKAAHRVNRKYGGRMVSIFSLMIRRMAAENMTLNSVIGDIDGLRGHDMDSDLHAGAMETAMVMHAARDCVDESYRDCGYSTVELFRDAEGRTMVPGDVRDIPVKDMLKAFRAVMDYFLVNTWMGAPSLATPEIGRSIIDKFAAMSTEALSDLWDGKITPNHAHSPLWPFRWIIGSDTLSEIFLKIVGIKSPIF